MKHKEKTEKNIVRKSPNQNDRNTEKRKRIQCNQKNTKKTTVLCSYLSVITLSEWIHSTNQKTE